MRLHPRDWLVVGWILGFTLVVGRAVARRAGRSSAGALVVAATFRRAVG